VDVIDIRRSFFAIGVLLDDFDCPIAMTFFRRKLLAQASRVQRRGRWLLIVWIVFQRRSHYFLLTRTCCSSCWIVAIFELKVNDENRFLANEEESPTIAPRVKTRQSKTPSHLSTSFQSWWLQNQSSKIMLASERTALSKISPHLGASSD